MSVRISGVEASNKVKPRGLKAAKAIAAFGYCFSVALLIGCVLSTVAINIDSKANVLGPYAPLLLAQDTLGALVVAIVMYQCYRVIDIYQAEGLFFSSNQGFRIRVIAICFLLIFLFQVGSTVAYCHAVGGNIGIGLNGDPFGFPSRLMWQLVGTQYSDSDLVSIGTDVAFNRDINLMPLAFSMIAWCLSYVFDSGQQMQQDQDQTL
ncbi:MAG: hypothetical protein Q4A43_03095 [Coriobacteriia bacterium]|nr:hypothetical protein [Coriobacteriia bacterium]